MKKRDLIQVLKMALYDLQYGIPVKNILGELNYALFQMPSIPQPREPVSKKRGKR